MTPHGVAVAVLAWSIWGVLAVSAGAGALGRDAGYPPTILLSLIASAAPCGKEHHRPASDRRRELWQSPRLWLVADCATEANRIPTNLTALASFNAGSWSVSLNWNAPPVTPTQYRVERSVNQGPFIELTPQPTTTSFTDSSQIITGTPVTSYVYRVRADYGGVPPLLSAPSSIDVATTITFTNDPLATGVIVDDQHVTQLRQAVEAVCRTAGETTPTWTTDPTITPQVTVIKKAHIEELRAKASECLAAVGVVVPPYSTDPSLIAGVTTVKKEHVQELRDALH